jgi:glycosyltransferase involved in cell wall biosynthesis
MAAALAVVSTSVGGIPELVTDGVDGLLVKPGDAAALAEALGRLAGDAPLRRRLGQAARQKVVQHFAVNVAVDSLAQLYTSLGARPRRDSA